MGSIDWSTLSDDCCRRSGCQVLKLRSRSLAGQLILTRAGPNVPITFRLHGYWVVFSLGSIHMRNRLTAESAFTLLHFMHHVDMDASFHLLNYFDTELAPCLPFNGMLMDVLASVDSSTQRGKGGWIRTKLDTIIFNRQAASSGLRLELGEWLQAEWLSCECHWPIPIDSVVLHSISGYGRRHCQRKMAVDLAVMAGNWWCRWWDDWLSTAAERILQHLIDQLPDLSGVVPTLVLYLPMGWQGWRTLWPSDVIGTTCHHLEEASRGWNGEEVVLRMPAPPADSHIAAEQQLLEVRICYGVRRIKGTSIFDRLLYDDDPVCRVTVRVVEVERALTLLPR